MRDYINLFRSLNESIENITDDEIKFWYSARENRFVDHAVDEHHVKMVATDPETFGMTPDEVAHHPHASGEYGDAGWDSDYEENGSYDAEEWADNNDMGLFANAFSHGWVRGGHFIDILTYHEMKKINHEGGIYLQGEAVRDVQKCVRACVKRWPDVSYFMIEDGRSFVKLQTWEAIDHFIKTGRSDLKEAPISDFHWDSEKAKDTTNFGKVDQELLSSPKGQTKIIRAFQKTPFNFEIFFNYHDYYDGDNERENDGVDSWAKTLRAGIHDDFGDIPGKPGTIRMVILSNLSPYKQKMPMTGWTLAHKIGHALQDESYLGGWRNNKFATKLLEIIQLINDISAAEEEYETYPCQTFEFPAWITNYMTMKSARTNKLQNGFETFAEIIAQYLVTGSVKMNLKKPAAHKVLEKLNQTIGETIALLVGKVVAEV